MQADERVRVEPVPADAVAAVDHRHATSAWSISASVNAIPIAPAPTTR